MGFYTVFSQSTRLRARHSNLCCRSDNLTALFESNLLALGNALLIVLDGVGFNRRSARSIVNATWSNLSDRSRTQIMQQVANTIPDNSGPSLDPEWLALLSLYPVSAEALEPETPFDEATQILHCLREIRSSRQGTKLNHEIRDVLREQAIRHRYVPWSTVSTYITSLRNQHMTIPTSAAGTWAGFEELNPPVQGNSETGHQQISNLHLALQTPLEISKSIDDGSFFHNPSIRGTLEQAKRHNANINFCFMLSGVSGSDGRVHSAWNHLEAFLALVFTEVGLHPRRVRMQAIVDGRDCPKRSSLEQSGTTGGYLNRLQKLLATFDAEHCLAWIVGRSIAMDRDYREANTMADYLLVTKGVGRHVIGFKGAIEAIKADHQRGIFDSDIQPIVVLDHGNEPRTVESGDAFVNLNFRSDRQRCKTAALVGACDLLVSEGNARGQNWRLDWLNPDLKLHICTISEYHPSFESKYGVKVAFPSRPLDYNLLAQWPKIAPQSRYSLIAESNKSSHMGYFIRGGREYPVADDIENRQIIPSYGKNAGILSDSDFYKTPQMRNLDIAQAISVQIDRHRPLLICANMSNCDMLGHLLPDHFNDAITAYEIMDTSLSRIVPHALENGYAVIVTSDHGNIEDDTPSHSTNDVLTTVIPSKGVYTPAKHETFQARLFDISWTLGSILGLQNELLSIVRPPSESNIQNLLIGRPLIKTMSVSNKH